MHRKFRNPYRLIPWLLVTSATACTLQNDSESSRQLAFLWTANAAEYHAVSRQAYRAATEDLPGFIADKSWSAIPYQSGAEDLPPAIILDIDQTVVNGVDFQLGHEPPFTAEKFDNWNDTHAATAVPGAPEFIALAREAGVRVFFLTNRNCNDSADASCVQKPITVQDLREAGVPADDAAVSLAGERPDWGSEKKVRRDYIAENFRVIMLFGDDLGDFIPCVRRRPSAPCTEGGTIANRLALTKEHAAYWGDGWYILPNPMYGSWTSVP